MRWWAYTSVLATALVATESTLARLAIIAMHLTVRGFDAMKLHQRERAERQEEQNATDRRVA